MWTIPSCIKGRVKWDKIFLLPPKNKFVDDGSRYRKNNLNKMQYLWEENNLGRSSCGSSSNGGCGSSSSYSYNDRCGGGGGGCGSSNGRC